MEYRTLGGTGTIVSSLCLGTMTFGNESSEEVSHAQLDRFLEQWRQLHRHRERLLARRLRGDHRPLAGRAPAGVRDEVVLATKGRFAMGDGPNDVGLSRTNLTRALDASLKRLQVDTIDLYQAHAWDALTPIEETLRFFDDAVQAPARSATPASATSWAGSCRRRRCSPSFLGLTPIVTLQPQYNLLVREIEFELTDVCENENIGILPWSPLAGGWLTGKYRRDEVPTGASRLGDDPERGMEAYAPRNAQERTWQVIDAVGKVAASRGVSMAQVALAWTADRPAVTSVILGARTVEQLDDNLAAASLHLTADETALLDEASDPDRRRLPVRPAGSRAAGERARAVAGRARAGS